MQRIISAGLDINAAYVCVNFISFSAVSLNLLGTMADMETISTRIVNAYTRLQGIKFTGVYESTRNLSGTRINRHIIRIDMDDADTVNETLRRVLHDILEMDNAEGGEVVWKAITRSSFDDVYGTRLWCVSVQPEENLMPGNQPQEFQITNVDALQGNFHSYNVIINVRVQILN